MQIILTDKDTRDLLIILLCSYPLGQIISLAIDGLRARAYQRAYDKRMAKKA